MAVDASSPWPWLAAAVAIAGGTLAFRWTWSVVASAWGAATAEAGRR